MAGYQRFVAYVYEYRKGKKDSSSGYVRVEARDRKCRVEVHLRCVGLEPGSRCRVYGFVRQEGLMDGILIGSCVTGRERIECALETDTGDIGGMGKSLQELGGLLLISDAGGFWGTEWDDQPIRPENFREWKKKETESRKAAEKTGMEPRKAAEKKGRERGEKEEGNQKDGTLPEVQENKKESDRIMTVEEIQEDVLKTSETGNSYQAPGPHPPEPPRPGQPSPHPPELPRPGQPSPNPPELPRPGQPSPHPPKPSRPEPSRPLPGFRRSSDTGILCLLRGRNEKLPGYPVSDDPGSRNSWYGAVICGFAKLFVYLHGCRNFSDQMLIKQYQYPPFPPGI